MITTKDILEVFPGAVVVSDSDREAILDRICRHCDEEKNVPLWRKGGKIVERLEADGVRVWACSFCGRKAAQG